jgi:hypothetical protein
MKVHLEDFKNTWYEISLGVKKAEIDNLIEKLHDLKGCKIDHFHITNNFEGEGGIGDNDRYEPYNIRYRSRMARC